MAKQKSDAEKAEAAARESIRLLEQEAKLRERMNSSYDEYIKAAKEAKVLQETLNRTTKLQEEIEKKIAAAKAKTLNLTDEELAAEEAKLEYLKKQNAIIGTQIGLYKSAAKEANVGAMALGKATASMVKATAKLPGLIKSSFGQLKGFGIFEMDKAMKQTALSMGVLSKESGGMRTTITNVAKQTTMIGVNLAKVAKLQEEYSYNIGRTVLLSEKGLNAMAEMSIVTGLGAEGTARMAADMDVVGLSAERTGQFVNQTLESSHKMGVNATKVMKNLAGNFKMLNKYHFKNGVKSLAEMAQLVTKLGVDMESTSAFADKLWNVEGAVEMSAQLNVMGGEWSKMSDPFHLMYMARNDMKGLTEEIANASKESVKFNKETGEFDMSTEGMHRLKIIAEQTGIAYDDLVTMGKNAKKFEKIESQINFSVGNGKEGKELKEFISSKSFLNKKGEATIMIDGKERLVKSLTEADKTLIKAQIAQQEDMRKRAEQSRTFDEQLGYFIDQLKIYLLPMLTGINKMMPKLDSFVAKFNAKGGWGDKLEALATVVGNFAGTIGSFILEWPKLSIGILALTKALPLIGGVMKLFGGVYDTIKWFKNGMSLASGFNKVASVGNKTPGVGNNDIDKVDGILDKFGKKLFNQKATGAAAQTGKGMMGNLKGGLKSFGGIGAGVLSGGLAAWDEWGENSAMGMSKGENTGRTVSKGAGAGLGAWGGAAAGAAIGSAVPVVGTIIGGLIGAALGAWGGGALGEAGGDAIYGDENRRGVHDGLFNKPVHDAGFEGSLKKSLDKTFKITGKKGSMKGKNLGSDFSNGNGVLQGGKITPIDNKDGFYTAKPGGPIDQAMKGGENKGHKTVKHEFGKMDISGTIKVETPGGNFDIAMIKDNQPLRRELNRIVKEEAVKMVKMGKP